MEDGMYGSLMFAAGLLVTGAMSAVVVAQMHGPLQRLLADLCGSSQRAEFWTVFSSLTVGLMPVIFALAYAPNLPYLSASLREIAELVKWGLIGTVASILVLGWMLGRAIYRPNPRPPQ
jgi:hypothetical protein